MAKRMPIPSKILTQLLDELEAGVSSTIEGILDPFAYGQLMKFLEKTFEREREDENLVKYTHRPWYLGIYAINPKNPKQGESLTWMGFSPACPVFEDTGGAIWTVYKSGKTLYLPDVEEAEREDPMLHASCTEGELEEDKMKGAEIVIPLFGPEYTKGRWKGQRSVLAAWDLDLNIKHIYGKESADSNPYVKRLERILREPGERIIDMMYGGESPFEPDKNPSIYVMSAKEVQRLRQAS